MQSKGTCSDVQQCPDMPCAHCTPQEMEAAIAAKEAEKVSAQRDLHEHRLRCRSGDCESSLRAHMRARSGEDDGVAHIIEDLEAQRIGAQCHAAWPLYRPEHLRKQGVERILVLKLYRKTVCAHVLNYMLHVSIEAKG